MSDTNEDNLPVFRARTATTITPAAKQTVLDTQIQKAQMLAQMGPALPQAYRGPGAAGGLLMAIDFADRNDLAIMDVVRWVSWLNGKPVIETDLLVQLANRAGIRVEVTDQGTEGTEARARLISPDGEPSPWETYTLEEARNAGLVKPKSAWDTHPRSMLRHRARKHALQFQGPAIGATVIPTDVDDDNPDTDPDPAPQPEPEPAGDTTAGDTATAPDTTPAGDDEWANPDPDPDPGMLDKIGDTPTVGNLRVLLKTAEWNRGDLKAWLEQEGHQPATTVDDLAGTPLGAALADVLEQEQQHLKL